MIWRRLQAWVLGLVGAAEVLAFPAVLLPQSSMAATHAWLGLGEMPQAPVFDSPQRVKDFVALRLGGLPHEVFAVLWLDAQHRLIDMQELFRGSLAQTSVYPREVLRQALGLNAGAAILAHNHPSGIAEPSRADEALTQSLVGALRLIEVRVLDHLVVGAGSVVSFAERGLM